jgi:hypothetical protein
MASLSLSQPQGNKGGDKRKQRSAIEPSSDRRVRQTGYPHIRCNARAHPRMDNAEESGVVRATGLTEGASVPG